LLRIWRARQPLKLALTTLPPALHSSIRQAKDSAEVAETKNTAWAVNEYCLAVHAYRCLRHKRSNPSASMRLHKESRPTPKALAIADLVIPFRQNCLSISLSIFRMVSLWQRREQNF
jgi:hypothetical protein